MAIEEHEFIGIELKNATEVLKKPKNKCTDEPPVHFLFQTEHYVTRWGKQKQVLWTLQHG